MADEANPVATIAHPMIQQSLKEIASLLLLLHEHYLKVDGASEVLAGLTSLTVDTGLDSIVSIIDCERLRRAVVKQKGGGSTDLQMGYELFYDWLRLLAQLVFKEQGSQGAETVQGDREKGQSGRRALHRLLTQYIIPFASKIGEGGLRSAAVSNSYATVDVRKAVPIYNPQFMNLVMEYSQFFLYWFYFLLSDEKVDGFSFHSCINIWKSIVCSGDNGSCPNLTSRKRLVDSFRRWNIVPGISSEENLVFLLKNFSRPQANRYLDHNPNPIDSNGDDKIEINFMQFLWLLDTLTQPNLEPERTANSIKMVEWKTQKVVKLISYVAEKLLLSTISRFSNSETSLMSATSFMWLMRQARLTLIACNPNLNPSSSIPVSNDSRSGSTNKDSILWWLEQIEHYAEPVDLTSQQHSSHQLEEEKYREIKTSNFSLAVYKLVYILFRIVEKRVVIPMSFLTATTVAMSMLGPQDKYILYLAAFAPLLCFAPQDIQPPDLIGFYEARNALKYSSGLGSLLGVFESEFVRNGFFSYSQSMALRIFDFGTSDISFSHSFTLSISVLKSVFCKSGLYPLLIPDLDLIDRVYERIIVFNPKLLKNGDNQNDEVLIPREYVSELFFCLSKCEEVDLTLNILRDTLRSLPGWEKSTDNCRDNYLVMMRLFLSDLLTDTSLRDLLRPNPIPSLTQTTSPVKARSSSSSSTHSNPNLKPQVSLHPLRDVIFLLLHYPLVSYSLNPWDVAYMAYTHHSDNHSNPPAASSGSGSSGSSGGNNSNSSHHVNANLIPSSPGGGTTLTLPLTDMLRKFCSFFHVSGEDMSAYFAVFESDKNSPSSVNREHALRSSVVDLTLSERVLRLLYLNSDLLKFEYARCLSRFLTSPDPIMEGALVPLSTVETRPRDTLLPLDCAFRWAKSRTQCSDEVIETYLRRISCVSQCNYLTFSTFILFAMYVFTSKMSEAVAQTLAENDFVGLIRKMLHTLAGTLTDIQQKMRMRVLGPMYRSKMEASFQAKKIDLNEKQSILMASIEYFNKTCLTGRIQSKTRVTLPPRPPTVLLDAPRFVLLCKQVGLLGRLHISVEVCWVAFGLYCKQQSVPGLPLWESVVVPPIPVRLTPESLQGILEVVAWIVDSAESDPNPTLEDSEKLKSEYIFEKVLTPVLCSHMDSGRQAALNKQDPSYPLLEDILRFGGSEAITSVCDLQDMLQASYHALLEKSLDVITEPSMFATPLLSFKSRERMYLECPVNLACRFFCCQDMLKMPAILALAKKSLHVRIRPTYVSKARGGNPTLQQEVATLSFSEFKELFIRCAFAAWDSWGGLTSASHISLQSVGLYLEECQKKCALLVNSSNPTSSSSSSSSVSGSSVSSAASVMGKGNNTREKEKGGKKQSWGFDFIRPYAEMVKYFNDNLFHIQSHVANIGNLNLSSSGNGVEHSNPNPAAKVNTAKLQELMISESAVVESTTSRQPNLTQHLNLQPNIDPNLNINLQCASNASVETNKSDEVLSDIISRRLAYQIADPAIRRRDELVSQPSDQPNRISLRGVSQFPQLSGGSSTHIEPHVSNSLIASSSSSSSSSTPTNTSNDSKAIVSDIHRFNSFSSSFNSGVNSSFNASPGKVRLPQRLGLGLNVSSSEKFITALDALLAGTKEALWPVYATYCSCGDSIDPGKLSGPNLFTLLSKLGILSDKTLLSDVGVLLYQISSHSNSPLDMHGTQIGVLHGALGLGPTDSPSLSFEEFLVFLYAFSELRFEGVVINPAVLQQEQGDDDDAEDGVRGGPEANPNTNREIRGHRRVRSTDMRNSETWFKKWLKMMGSSRSFRHLLEECVLPILKKQTLLAFPEDARLRDKFSCVFSLEVLRSIEGAEGPLQSFFESERLGNLTHTSSSSLSSAVDSHRSSSSRVIELNVIMSVLRRINLVPTVINEPQVAQLIRDVMPEDLSAGKTSERPFLLFPQWEWVLAVVAFQAVEAAIAQSSVYTNPSKIPSLVAGVITSIASAITQYQ